MHSWTYYCSFWWLSLIHANAINLKHFLVEDGRNARQEKEPRYIKGQLHHKPMKLYNSVLLLNYAVETRGKKWHLDYLDYLHSSFPQSSILFPYYSFYYILNNKIMIAVVSLHKIKIKYPQIPRTGHWFHWKWAHGWQQQGDTHKLMLDQPARFAFMTHAATNQKIKCITWSNQVHLATNQIIQKP